MVLMIDTTAEHIGQGIAEELRHRDKNAVKLEVIDTAGMHISHCVGCNYCWLKTPGVCDIHDDYEPILRKMSGADQVWLVSDTHFGFVSWQTKNIVDRIMPLVTMYLKFKDGQMRHVMPPAGSWGYLYRRGRPGVSEAVVPAHCAEFREPFAGRFFCRQ